MSEVEARQGPIATAGGRSRKTKHAPASNETGAPWLSGLEVCEETYKP